MTSLVHQIRYENFEEQVILVKVPFLLLCMVRNADFIKQLKLLETIAEKYQQKLEVGVWAEESIEVFKKRLQIIGIPTFLFFVEGKEIGRRLGTIDQEILADFVSKYLPLH